MAGCGRVDGDLNANRRIGSSPNVGAFQAGGAADYELDSEVKRIKKLGALCSDSLRIWAKTCYHR